MTLHIILKVEVHVIMKSCNNKINYCLKVIVTNSVPCVCYMWHRLWFWWSQHHANTAMTSRQMMHLRITVDKHSKRERHIASRTSYRHRKPRSQDALLCETLHKNRGQRCWLRMSSKWSSDLLHQNWKTHCVQLYYILNVMHNMLICVLHVYIDENN